jgi:hypothetical protein
MVTLHAPGLEVLRRSSAWPILKRFKLTAWLVALALMAVAAAAATAQNPNPLVTRQLLPSPGCGGASFFAIADFDASGHQDFVAMQVSPAPALRLSHDPVVSPGGGACVTTAIPTAPLSANIQPLLANLNGDAFPDLLVDLGPGGGIYDAMGNGIGGFVIPGTGPYPVQPPNANLASRIVRDFNHDGRDDVAIVNNSSLTLIEVHLNLPSGWTMSWSLSVPAAYYPINAGDFDGDGNDDLVWTDAVLQYVPSALRIAYGSGSGTFTPAPAPLFANTDFLSFDDVADLDGDGLQDLVVRRVDLGISPYNVPIIWGAAAPTAPTLTLVLVPYDQLDTVRAVDFDRDGTVDLVALATPFPNAFTRDIVLFRGLGGRQFSAPIVLATEPLYFFTNQRLHLLDVDGDQDVDLLLTTEGQSFGYQLLLFRNQTIRASGCPGTGGLAPSCSVGTATPGNQAFAIGLSSALPGSFAALGVSLAPVAVNGCGLAIDPSPWQLILPMGPVGILPTSASGSASMALPLPPPPALSGMTFHAQWAVLDPQGSFPALGLSLALSDARTIHVW